MTDTTATFYDITSFDGRIFCLSKYRRTIRIFVDDVVTGLRTKAAVCVLVITYTVAAAWIINTALSTNTNLHAKAPIGKIAFANHQPMVVSEADFSGSARISTDPADALTFEARWARTTAPASTPDALTFEARWARVMAPASTSTGAVPLVPQHPVERASNVASLQPYPLRSPQRWAKPEIARAPDSTHIAELSPAATPASARPSNLPHPAKLTPEQASSVPLPRPHPAQRDIARSPISQAVPQVAGVMPSPLSTFEKPVTPQQAHNKSMPLPDPDSRTAIYDIAAHTVYMPNGDRLEAHSGLGNKLDDPRYVSVKDRGPTPPNVYDLALRKQLFHDVRVIRLNPVGGGNMFGRSGMLAHPYMLGANGQSNGCVSFKDYPAFLRAYLRGKVDRLVVVPHIGDTSLRTASARRGPARRYADNNP
jgi:hypothetical protein